MPGLFVGLTSVQWAPFGGQIKIIHRQKSSLPRTVSLRLRIARNGASLGLVGRFIIYSHCTVNSIIDHSAVTMHCENLNVYFCFCLMVSMVVKSVTLI